MQAYFKATKAIESILGHEQARPVIDALNIGISAFENKFEEQRPILKAEIKDEMSKELASKADLALVKTELKAEINRVEIELKSDIETVRAELKTDIEKVRAELKADLDNVRAGLKAEVNQLRSEMKYNFRIIWIFMAIILFFSASANPIFQHLLKMLMNMPK